MDETKASGLLLAIVLVAPSDVAAVRRTMNALRMRGQRRIHFAKESPARRGAIAAAISAMPITAVVVDARRVRSGRDARERALTGAVGPLVELGVDRLTIEQDDSLVESDRRALFRATRGLARPFVYNHARPSTEPLLWIPDAVAWSVARGGDAERRISTVISADRIVVL